MALAFSAASALASSPSQSGFAVFSAIFPLFTVLRRVRYTYGLLNGQRAQGILNELAAIAPWRQRRGSPAYILFCAVVTAAIIAAPLASPFFYGASDPLGALLSRLGP